MEKKRVLILGAAGRDFHDFNMLFRENNLVQVVAFTAAQIPDIAGRIYPASLAGKLYPAGIPILEEDRLEAIIKEQNIVECLLSYSDLSYADVMHLASRVISSGAAFTMAGASQTMLKSSKPVIAVVAVRTGSGKSQTSRAILEILQKEGKRVVAIRHPMPYGDLEKQRLQRFGSLTDLDSEECTIEEMEEYEPYLKKGFVIYAGVDYKAILEEAEKEADVILWDGGNNDTSFYQPDLVITVADPLRAGHEVQYYPGEINLRMADVVLINKIDSAQPVQVETIVKNTKQVNPRAEIIKAASEITVDDPELITGKRVLVIEDGPTLTHGNMQTGAGVVAAKRNKAAVIIEPGPFAVGSIKHTFEKYPEMKEVLPAMGYGKHQMHDLEETINVSDAQTVIIGTPIDLARHININKPTVRVYYELSEDAKSKLRKVLIAKGFI